MAVELVGVDVYVKLGDSRSNGYRDVRGVVECRTNEHDRGLSHEAEAFRPKRNRSKSPRTNEW